MKAPAARPLLKAEGLTVDFGAASGPALRDISFELGHNEILGVVGETGAGKSVLARALIDLLPAGGRVTGGDVQLKGESVLTMSAAGQRALRGGRISLIGTNPKALLDPVCRVGVQVARVLQAHRQISKAAALRAAIELLASVGIPDPERRSRAYPHELSGGMAQRIVIAMALIAEPDVVVADDATLGLDATIQVQVLELLVRRCRELGAGVVLITHDLGIVAHYCQRVAVMRKGEVVELRPVRELLADPQAAESRTLVAAARVRPTPLDRQPPAPGAGPDHRAPLLSVAGLIKHFPIGGTKEVVRAVDGVSFQIDRGQTLALVGESGSGKTTVGQCLLRLIDPGGGRILFDGTDLAAIGEREMRGLRRRIQMVFQEPYVALNPRWRVADLIGEPLGLLPEMGPAERQRRVSTLLELVRLPARLSDRFPHELTAGEQKRVGIARALATRPDFVVFDEPTTALDIRVRGQIIDLVRELQAEFGLSALFITHDLNSVRSLAQYVAVMKTGVLVEQGETERIFAAPEHAYTKMLLSAELPIETAEQQREEIVRMEAAR